MKHLLLTTIAAVVLVGCASPLMWDAARNGDIKAVKQHLAAGTDVNVKGGYSDETPLHSAAVFNYYEIAELLIANGADMNAKSRRGGTPLHRAAWRGHKEVAALLIAEGADVKTKDEVGRTPLDMASQYKETETAALLRKHGGKSGAEDSLHVAAWVGNIEAVKQHLIAGVNMNAKIKLYSHLGNTPLHNAAGGGHKEVVELLIAGSADVNATDRDGETPLDTAIRRKHPEITDLLRKHGGKTKKELNELLSATGEGDIKAVKQHLAAGADVNAKDHRKRTPLLIAAFADRKEIAELLIAEGANVNAKGIIGGTVLHNTALNDQKEFAELLITKGADVNAKDNHGTTPLDYAISRNHTETADLLRKHGDKHGTIHGAAGGGDIEAVKGFLANGADVNAKNKNYGARNKYGRTPLYLAVDEGHTEIADLLRKHGGKTGEELKAEGK